MKPIKPGQVKVREVVIPDSIIGCVNEMISSEWDGKQARIEQKDLLKKVLEKDKTLDSDEIFDKHFFDFEDIFRKCGWVVEYDRPGYNESYEAYFIFRKKRAK